MNIERTIITSVSMLLCSLATWAQSPTGWVVEWGFKSGSGGGERSPNFDAKLVTLDGQWLEDVIAVSAGQNHNLALKRNGTVVGWGGNLYGAATGAKGQENGSGIVRVRGRVLSNVVAVSASSFSMALLKDGTVTVWGDEGKYSPPLGLSNVVAISAGWLHGLALTQEGFVVGWGNCNMPPPGLSNITAIAASPSASGCDVAVTKDGIIAEWNVRGGIDLRTGLLQISNAVGVASGGAHRLALKRDGSVAAWGSHYGFGNPQLGQTDVPKTLTNATVVAAGGASSMALQNNGTVVTWGGDKYLQGGLPGGMTGGIAVAAGSDYCLAITTNRAVAERFMSKGK